MKKLLNILAGVIYDLKVGSLSQGIQSAKDASVFVYDQKWVEEEQHSSHNRDSLDMPLDDKAVDMEISLLLPCDTTVADSSEQHTARNT